MDVIRRIPEPETARPTRGGRGRTHNCRQPGTAVRNQDVLTNLSDSDPVCRNPHQYQQSTRSVQFAFLLQPTGECLTPPPESGDNNSLGLFDFRHPSVDPSNRQPVEAAGMCS